MRPQSQTIASANLPPPQLFLEPKQGQIRATVEPIEHYCPLCIYLNTAPAVEDNVCHHRLPDQQRETKSTGTDDHSYYTARSPSPEANKVYRAAVIEVTAPPNRSLGLRHKTSPTEVSLRELRAQQSRERVLRERESDARLQQAYERQVMAYLSGSVGVGG